MDTCTSTIAPLSSVDVLLYHCVDIGSNKTSVVNSDITVDGGSYHGKVFAIEDDIGIDNSGERLSIGLSQYNVGE